MASVNTWALKRKFPFEASHQLPHHDGKCARLHGHSWKLTVEVRGRVLIDPPSPQQGMISDYAIIKKIVQPFVDSMLDHRHLNATTELENPTSEQIACWVYWKLKPMFVLSKINLSAVTISETDQTECEYRPEFKTQGTRKK